MVWCGLIYPTPHPCIVRFVGEARVAKMRHRDDSLSNLNIYIVQKTPPLIFKDSGFQIENDPKIRPLGRKTYSN